MSLPDVVKDFIDETHSSVSDVNIMDGVLLVNDATLNTVQQTSMDHQRFRLPNFHKSLYYKGAPVLVEPIFVGRRDVRPSESATFIVGDRCVVLRGFNTREAQQWVLQARTNAATDRTSLSPPVPIIFVVLSIAETESPDLPHLADMRASVVSNDSQLETELKQLARFQSIPKSAPTYHHTQVPKMLASNEVDLRDLISGSLGSPEI